MGRYHLKNIIYNSIETVEYTGINLTRYVQDLYTKNYNTWEKLKTFQRSKNMYHFNVLENFAIFIMLIVDKLICSFKTIATYIPWTFSKKVTS